jgi:hypothetical protein
MCFISSSDRIPWDGLKQGLSFLGMVMYVQMILEAATTMSMFTPNMLKNGDEKSRAVYLWLEIEQVVFMSTLFSNIIFLLIRSQIRHKLQLDSIDEKK